MRILEFMEKDMHSLDSTGGGFAVVLHRRGPLRPLTYGPFVDRDKARQWAYDTMADGTLHLSTFDVEEIRTPYDAVGGPTASAACAAHAIERLTAERDLLLLSQKALVAKIEKLQGRIDRARRSKRP